MMQPLLRKLAHSGLVVAPTLSPAHVRGHPNGWRSIVGNIHRRSQSCADIRSRSGDGGGCWVELQLHFRQRMSRLRHSSWCQAWHLHHPLQPTCTSVRRKRKKDKHLARLHLQRPQGKGERSTTRIARLRSLGAGCPAGGPGAQPGDGGRDPAGPPAWRTGRAEPLDALPGGWLHPQCSACHLHTSVLVMQH